MNGIGMGQTTLVIQVSKSSVVQTVKRHRDEQLGHLDGKPIFPPDLVPEHHVAISKQGGILNCSDLVDVIQSSC